MRAELINAWLTRQNLPPLTETQTDRLSRFQARLLEVNTYMNLTAITKDEDIAVKHFIDSLTLLPWLHSGARVVDVGAGAGFPGIPLKIMRPELQWTMVDSLRKRVLFLQEIADMLGLSGVECVHARAEELFGRLRGSDFRAQYDVCTVRAVARLEVLAGYTLPFLKRGGVLLAMKGPDVADEVEQARPALAKYGGAQVAVETVEISEGILHTVVVVEKR